MPAQLDPVVPLASSIHAAPGTVALLLGSGISRAAQVPTGWDVVVELTKRLAVIEDEAEPDDPIAWYTKRFDGEPDYSALLGRLAPTPAERRNLLERSFVPTEEEREQGIKTPTAAHKAIAGLVVGGYVRVIVTTNFDRLLEAALVEAGVQPVVITNEAAAKGAIPLAHSRCTIIKVHGDYLDPDLKNTADELDHYAPGIDKLLDQVFDEYGLIVCGWSGAWDEALRKALQRAPNRRYGTYWTHISPLDERAQTLATLRQAVDVPIAGADAFFESLIAKVTALAEALDQRPTSTAMAIAELKRYLPEDRHRIRLHDLLMGQVDLILARPNRVNDYAPVTTEALRERLREHEAATATLLALLVHAGYFADRREHDDLLVGVLRRLASRRSELDGVRAWSDLKRYPVLMAVYALGLGSLAAGRLDAFARALASIPVQARGGIVPLGLAAGVWWVLDDAQMQPLFGQERRSTPSSDYLHGRLREAARGVLPHDHEYDETFDELEYLLGVVFAFLRGGGRGPIGRFSWRGFGDTLLPDEALTRHATTLLSAGLFDGSADTLDAAKTAYDDEARRQSSRML